MNLDFFAVSLPIYQKTVFVPWEVKADTELLAFKQNL